MIRPLFFLAVLITAMLLYGQFSRLSAVQKKEVLTKGGIGIAALIILFLILTGRISVLFGVLAALLGWAMRLMQAGILFSSFRQGFTQARGAKAATDDRSMSRKEAADILGVSISASEAEILQAYKRLMAKNHPDAGGSEGLARRLNQARDCLLKK